MLPVVSKGCDDVLCRLSSWRYIIKTDLTKSFFQIPLEKGSVPYLATTTPFKGLRVYLRSAMGMPGSSEHLQELTSRVFGDFIQERFVLVLADDLHIGGNSIDELYYNWHRVLQRISENNLTLSASKTVICPKSTTILGWKWESGKISVLQHKISPLITASTHGLLSDKHCKGCSDSRINGEKCLTPAVMARASCSHGSQLC